MTKTLRPFHGDTAELDESLKVSEMIAVLEQMHFTKPKHRLVSIDRATRDYLLDCIRIRRGAS
jgi:hypothetical protein